MGPDRGFAFWNGRSYVRWFKVGGQWWREYR